MKITARQVNYNLTYHLRRATDEHVEQGLNFYPFAKHKAQEIAHDTGNALSTVADVISILSPFNIWESNLMQAQALCFAFNFEPHTIEKIPFTTFEANVKKGIKRLEEGRRKASNILTYDSRKTYSFARNIEGDFINYVTIDRHMLRAINYPSNTIGPKEYDAISEVIKRYALDRTDFAPAQLQSIVWHTVRK